MLALHRVNMIKWTSKVCFIFSCRYACLNGSEKVICRTDCLFLSILTFLTLFYYLVESYFQGNRAIYQIWRTTLRFMFLHFHLLSSLAPAQMGDHRSKGGIWATGTKSLCKHNLVKYFFLARSFSQVFLLRCGKLTNVNTSNNWPNLRRNSLNCCTGLQNLMYIRLKVLEKFPGVHKDIPC